jgi:hypothetical protein
MTSHDTEQKPETSIYELFMHARTECLRQGYLLEALFADMAVMSLHEGQGKPAQNGSSMGSKPQRKERRELSAPSVP